MDKIICFIIEKKPLYKEIDLVQYNVPIFYICANDEDEKYLVLCIDEDECEYLITHIELDTLISLIEGKIEMRQPFVDNEKIYRVKTGMIPEKDDVVMISSKDILDEELPDKDAFLVSPSQDVVFYSQVLQIRLEISQMMITVDSINHRSEIIHGSIKNAEKFLHSKENRTLSCVKLLEMLSDTMGATGAATKKRARVTRRLRRRCITSRRKLIYESLIRNAKKKIIG